MSFWNESRHVYAQFIAERIKDQRVLDIGCLGCKEKNLLRTHAVYAGTAKEVVGVDNDPTFLEKARKTGANVQICDITNREQVDAFVVVFGKFDHAIATEVIEHVGNARAFLENITRMLNPGGLFHIATPNAVCPTWIGMVGNNKVIQHPSHISWYCEVTLPSALKQSGFTVKETCFFHSRRDKGWAERFGLSWQEKFGDSIYVLAEVPL